MGHRNRGRGNRAGNEQQIGVVIVVAVMVVVVEVARC